VADVVIDTTGSPAGLAQALMLAQREVHLKSTHGQPAVGLAHLTAAVVDELSIEAVGLPQSRSLEEALADTPPLCRDDRRCVGRVGAAPPSQAPAKDGALWVDAPDARSLLADLEARHAADPRQRLPRVDAVVVDSLAELDRVIRPDPTREASPLRPTGRVLLRNGDGASSADAEAAPLANGLARGLRISTSRCGDFRAAVELLAHDTPLRRLGEVMVTHRFPATALADAFACARSPEGLKVLVEHDAEDDAPGA
jgi:hypothetical protein